MMSWTARDHAKEVVRHRRRHKMTHVPAGKYKTIAAPDVLHSTQQTAHPAGNQRLSLVFVHILYQAASPFTMGAGKDFSTAASLILMARDNLVPRDNSTITPVATGILPVSAPLAFSSCQSLTATPV